MNGTHSNLQVVRDDIRGNAFPSKGRIFPLVCCWRGHRRAVRDKGGTRKHTCWRRGKRLNENGLESGPIQVDNKVGEANDAATC